MVASFAGVDAGGCIMTVWAAYGTTGVFSRRWRA
jgi:hypothetical protein